MLRLPSMVPAPVLMALLAMLWLLPPHGLRAEILKDIAIIEAAKGGGIAEARGAFLKGESVNSRSRGGTPALVAAVEHGNISVLRFLLDEGANPDLPDRRSGRSGLLIAAESGDTAMVRMLLEAKADPNRADRQGETPLMKAARAGAAEAVQLLIKAGADVNATDYAGHTAVWHAGDARQARIAQLIQQAGGS